MMNEAFIIKLRKSDIVKNVDLLSNGNLRIQTAFQYSDGAYVDVFIENFENVDLDKEFLLSDFGSTIQWLESALIEYDKNLLNRILVSRVKLHGIVFDEEEFYIKVKNEKIIFDSIIALGQICVVIIDSIRSYYFAIKHIRFNNSVVFYGSNFLDDKFSMLFSNIGDGLFIRNPNSKSIFKLDSTIGVLSSDISSLYAYDDIRKLRKRLSIDKEEEKV